MNVSKLAVTNLSVENITVLPVGVGAGVSLITRFFITGDPVLFTSYRLSKPKVFAGNYSLKLKYATSVTGTAMDFFDGGYGVDSSGNFVMPAGVSDLLINDISVGLTSAMPLDGKLNRIEIIASGGATIEFVGQSGSGGNYFAGVLADPVFTDLGVVDNNLNWTLGNETANIEYPAENAFGSDLAVVLASSVPSGWVENSVKNYTLDGTSIALSRTTFGGMLTIGDTYLLTLTVSNYTSGDVFFNSSSFNSEKKSSNGVLEVLYTATHEEIRLRTTNANAELDVEFTFAKSITNAIIYNNIPTSIRGEFSEEVYGGSWISSKEMAVNGGFDSDTDWTTSGNWVIEDGVANYDGLLSGRFIRQDVGFSIDNVYRISYDIIEIGGGEIQMYDGNSYGYNQPSIGKASFDVVMLGTDSALHLKKNGFSTATIDNVSVKRIIEKG